MIRINLLPGKKDARSAPEESQGWLIAILVSIGIVLLALFFFHKRQEDEVDELARKNARVRNDTAAIQSQISDHDKVKTQLAELRDRESAIERLQHGRSGPTWTLLELSYILSPGKGPTTDREHLEQLKRDNPSAVPNPNWDTRRLWLTKYAESQRVVKIEGLARDGEDVAEFLRRMALSDLFSDVRPLPATEVTDRESKVSLKQFAISAKVRY